ncbi:hypothetical protein L6452_36276 [Arctium lappa]|uniref:Uncharacterized protein n=1 Tax=Arctium lappa TaxID=4217 RepID=A0ACB8YA22_ARCLA|nr:hypothetical protein L6452_36276 [Arctium lappa]
MVWVDWSGLPTMQVKQRFRIEKRTFHRGGSGKLEDLCDPSAVYSKVQNLSGGGMGGCWELKKSLSMVNAASSELLLPEDFKS